MSRPAEGTYVVKVNLNKQGGVEWVEVVGRWKKLKPKAPGARAGVELVDASRTAAQHITRLLQAQDPLYL